MEMCERGPAAVPPEILADLFHNLATDLIFFVLFQFVSFPAVIGELAAAVAARRLRAGRDRLMWLLLQFVSGSIQKNPAADFMPVLALFSMYEEDEAAEPLPVPDTADPACVEAMAAAGMFVHLQRKAASENINFGVRLPPSLALHHEFLMGAAGKPCSLSSTSPDYKVSLLCNSFSTTQARCFIFFNLLISLSAVICRIRKFFGL
jgi:mediator of RNA polymerase II transcription subunit 23